MFIGLALILGLATPALCGPPEIETAFHNSVDIAGFRTCSWVDGRPAPNRQVEEVILTQVESELLRLGYAVGGDSGDCTLRSEAIRDGYFPVGMLIISVFDSATGDLAWQSTASGMVKSEPKQIQKLAKKTVKKMFERFPEARDSQ
jgi:hypothetical protein